MPLKETMNGPAVNISGHILEDDIPGAIQAMTFALAKEQPEYFFTSVIFEERMKNDKDGYFILFDAFIRNETESYIVIRGSVHLTKMFYDPFNSVSFYGLHGR